ncbi:hypothetical protein EMIHUDRAFT_470970, partial [Emiliania huxleyi CCMP1516]|uniref:Pentacotripeptide-repeat region of PRORP domain-containing protein n=2 Tax=Emiliania huxleyi TaxID=2903 RepID=A0A0D3IGL0_EMIH1
MLLTLPRATRFAAPPCLSRSLATRRRSRPPVTNDEAVRVLQRLASSPASPAARTGLADCLERLAENKQSDLAWRLYTRLDAAGSASLAKPEYTAFLHAVGSIGVAPLAARAGRIEADMRAAGEDDPLCEWQLCVLLQAAANAGRFDDARAAYEGARGRLPPGVISRSLAQPRPISLQAFERHLASDLASPGRGQARHDPRRGTVSEGASTTRPRHAPQARPALTALMNAFARRGDLATLAALQRRADEAGVPLYTERVNAMLLGCREVGDAAEAVTVKLLLDACERGGAIHTALDLYEAAAGGGGGGEGEGGGERGGGEGGGSLEVDALTRNSLIRHYLRAGRPEGAFRVFSEARRRGQTPPANLKVLAALAEGCSAASEVAETEEEGRRWMGRALELYAASEALLAARADLAYESEQGGGAGRPGAGRPSRGSGGGRGR